MVCLQGSSPRTWPTSSFARRNGTSSKDSIATTTKDCFLEQCAGLHASVVPQVRRNPDQLHCVTRLHVCILWRTPHNYCNQAVALRTRPMSVIAIFQQQFRQRTISVSSVSRGSLVGIRCSA